MMDKRGKRTPDASQHDFSVDEILEEARGRFSGKSYAELIGEEEESEVEEIILPPKKSKEKKLVEPPPKPDARVEGTGSSSSRSNHPQHTAGKTVREPLPEKPVKSQPEPEITAPNRPELPRQAPPAQPESVRFEEEEQTELPKEKKGFFSRLRNKNKKKIDFDEEEDIYYGLQLKGLEEYRKGFNEDTEDAKPAGPTAAFSYLFDETQENDVDTEISERFSKIHEEREKRIAKLSKSGDPLDDIYSIYSHSQLESSVQKLPPEPIQLAEVKARAHHAAQADGSVAKKTEKPQVIGKTLEFRMPDRPMQEPPKKAEAVPVVQPEKKEVKKSPPYTPPVKQTYLGDTERVVSITGKRTTIPETPATGPQKNYRPHNRPIHLLEVDNLISALEYEAKSYLVQTNKRKPKFLENVPDLQDEENSAQSAGRGAGIHSNIPAEKPRRFTILGEEEEDNDPQDELLEEPEELDDYHEPANAPSIYHELNANIRKVLLRMTVTGILTLLLLVLGLLCERFAMLPEILQVQVSTLGYLITNLVFVGIAFIFCGPTIFNGLKSLIKLHADSDSGIAVACFAVLVQSIAVLFAQNEVTRAQIHLYSAIAVGGLFLNMAGKLSMVRRIQRNFRFVASPEPKLSVELFDDYNTSLQMAKDCVSDSPVIAYQRNTKFLKNFLHNSYETDPAEMASQTIAPIGFLCSLALCIAVLFLSKSVIAALTAFTAATCISMPICNMLSVNMPVARLCKLGLKCGTMVVGYKSVEYFCNTNGLMLDAKDLFPKGTVVLNGIKTFGGQRIDDAILDATALMCAAGGPLSDLFDQIIKNKRDMLPKIDNMVYEDERGVIGWVSGRRILVGNRDLMSAHSVEPPSHDYEKKYLLGGKQVIYLASGGELVAMFVLSYHSDKRRALELQRMENNGISLIVRTCDPNITPAFLAQCFHLEVQSIRVLPERLGEVYWKLVSKPLDRTSALFATKGRPNTLMRMLTACIRQKSNISLAIVMQNIAIVLGFVLVAFLSCYSGLQQLSSAALVLYEIFWLLVILVVPRIRKP